MPLCYHPRGGEWIAATGLKGAPFARAGRKAFCMRERWIAVPRHKVRSHASQFCPGTMTPACAGVAGEPQLCSPLALARITISGTEMPQRCSAFWCPMDHSPRSYREPL